MVRHAVSAADSDSSGVIEPDEVAAGSIQAVYHYDGLNRRTLAEIDLARDSSGDLVESGGSNIALSDLAAGYHYYYNGWSAIETRNGSEQVIKQQVWCTQYIDEVCQVAVNDDPSDENEDDCETTYYALTGVTYNVEGLADSTGNLVERYEYTPYGQRQVYSSCGDNDPALMNPLPISQRVQVSSEDQPYGLCEFGHQGLMHDEATPGLVDNRNRPWHTILARWITRDPLGYPDGMNTYAGYHILHGGVDPSGALSLEHVNRNIFDIGFSTKGDFIIWSGISVELDQHEKQLFRNSGVNKGTIVAYKNIEIELSTSDGEQYTLQSGGYFAAQFKLHMGRIMMHDLGSAAPYLSRMGQGYRAYFTAIQCDMFFTGNDAPTLSKIAGMSHDKIEKLKDSDCSTEGSINVSMHFRVFPETGIQ